MGVFARLLRRSKATEEAVTEDVTSAEAPATGEAPAEPAESDAAEAKAEPATEAAATVEPAGEAAEPAPETDADDGVGIPRQQSAGEAADSEAGEGART